MMKYEAYKSFFVNPAEFGFLPEASGIKNTKALQKALDRGGTIVISRPGTYKLAGTVYIGSHTSLVCGNNVFIKKVDEQGTFTHVILNKGALTKTYDEHISIENLHIIVNGIDVRTFKEVFGLHGQIAFFYIKDLKIEGFRCMDLGALQYGIHVCTFEDIIINDIMIKGDKDGVHLGRGKRFRISNGVFETFDDAIALNAHDYDVGNPELGWIEDGIVENCHDLDAEKMTGYFCRILAGAWRDWQPGMEVQKSDTVVAHHRLYRVREDADGKIYTSHTEPSHESGTAVLDGIHWVMVQDDVTYTAGVRNVIFRNIFLSKARIGFSVHFDNDRYSRSYYPGSKVPSQEQLTFENIRVLHDEKKAFLSIGTPMNVITVSHSSLNHNPIHFHGNKAMSDYLKTKINMFGCVFNHRGTMDLIINSVENKMIELKTFSNIEVYDEFKANIIQGNGQIEVYSDLTGLKN